MATVTSVQLVGPCLSVRADPIRLDDTLGFHATGTVTGAAGFETAHVGDPWPIAGRVTGQTLVVNDDTLEAAARSPGGIVCNQ